MNNENDITSFFGEPISIYTSSQAEKDGILVATGHPLINYITRTVYEREICTKIDFQAYSKCNIGNSKTIFESK